MQNNKLYDVNISDVSTTLLLTLYAHALESKSQNPILLDPKAEEIVSKINQELAKSNNKLYKRLVKGKINHNLVVHIVLRAKKYDEYARQFLERFPNGVIVNIGCGLDTRFWRIDNGNNMFYDLDLPDVIEIKRKFLKENERYRFIASDVFNNKWMSEISKKNKGPFLFLAEGVFMYLDGKKVKSLVLELQSRFSGSELVCEVVNSLWVSKPLNKLVNFKLHREIHLGKDTTYNFGISNSAEMETWNPSIKLIDDWSYFDAQEKKLGWLRLFKNIELFKKTQWTVHYKLGKES